MSKELKPVKIKITNFQSIQEIELEVRGFTCITGKTNIGKSAIMRAISKSILNDPVVGMVRKGENFSTVEVKGGDWEYKWEKGVKGVNRYYIEDRVLDKTGQNQIEEIKKLGFESIKLGGDEVQPWFASQFAPIFLLDKTGPQITDFVSEISGLNVLQDAIVLSSRGRKKSTDVSKEAQEELTIVRDKLAKLNGIDELIKLMKDLEAQKQSIIDNENKLQKIKDHMFRTSQIRSQLTFLSQIDNFKFPNSQLDHIKIDIQANKIWIKMRECAEQIKSLKDIKNNVISNVPTDIIKSYQAINKIKISSKLKKQILIIDHAKNTGLTQIPSDEINKLQTIIKLNSTVLRLKKQVRSIDDIPKKISNISCADDMNKLRSIFNSADKRKKTELELEKIIKESSEVLMKISHVESEIEKIPKCPSCGRVCAIHRKESHISM